MLFFPFLNLKNAFLERIHPSVQLKKRTQKAMKKEKNVKGASHLPKQHRGQRSRRAERKQTTSKRLP